MKKNSSNLPDSRMVKNDSRMVKNDSRIWKVTYIPDAKYGI
jgi:hypothetical protein